MRRPSVSLLLLPLLAAGCGTRPPAAARTAHPMRVMSINQCTDQLVLALLPPERIVSVSWLARDPGGSVMAPAAARVPVNHATAEEVIAQHPDLIVADAFGQPMLRHLLKRLGYPLVEVDEASDLAGIRRATRQVAAATDTRAKGEALIAAMDRGFAALRRLPPSGVRVTAWSRDGIGAAPGTTTDMILSAAGVRNVSGGSSGGVEALLRADPALLIESGVGVSGRSSLGDGVLRHPLVRRFWARRTVALPGGYIGCGTPMIAAGAGRLRRALGAHPNPQAPFASAGIAP